MKITKDGKREYCCAEMCSFCGKLQVNTELANQEYPLLVRIPVEGLGRFETTFYYCPFCGDKIDVEKEDDNNA